MTEERNYGDLEIIEDLKRSLYDDFKSEKKRKTIVCKQCGAVLSSDYAFCNKCGSAL